MVRFDGQSAGIDSVKEYISFLKRMICVLGMYYLVFIPERYW